MKTREKDDEEKDNEGSESERISEGEEEGKRGTS